MYRMLLALSLALAVPAALAAEPVPVESEAPGCTKAKPAFGGPRWHSLLPGMIR